MFFLYTVLCFITALLKLQCCVLNAAQYGQCWWLPNDGWSFSPHSLLFRLLDLINTKFNFLVYYDIMKSFPDPIHRSLVDLWPSLLWSEWPAPSLDLPQTTGHLSGFQRYLPVLFHCHLCLTWQTRLTWSLSHRGLCLTNKSRFKQLHTVPSGFG